MNKFFIYISIFIQSSLTLSTASAQLKTHYTWYKKSNSIDSGSCYEIDSKTNGQNLKSKVDAKKCRPHKTIFAFHFKTGKCLEIDEQTEGNSYFDKVDTIKCKPDQTFFKFANFDKRSFCYEVDAKTSGQKYYRKVKNKKCDSSQTEYYWKPKNENQGTCYAKISDQYVKAKSIKCRPENTVYQFVRLSKIKGKCFEQDSKSANHFSIPAKLSHCRPLKKSATYFALYVHPKKQTSSCYELDTETNGNKYISKVSIEECKK